MSMDAPELFEPPIKSALFVLLIIFPDIYVISKYLRKCYLISLHKFSTMTRFINNRESNISVDSEEHHLVFVYGTLKRGEPNHDLLSEKLGDGGAEFVGEAKTVHRWPLVIASRFNIPYLLHSKDKGEHVSGELYSVNSQALKLLDELECHPTYYTRVHEEVMTPEGSTLKPWIYFLFQFRPELLQLPCLGDYRSKGNHGKEYVPRYNRSKEEYHSDVKM